MAIVSYKFAEGLKKTLQVSMELQNETGITPVGIYHDEKVLDYDEHDALLVSAGDMTEEQYSERHLQES